MIEKDSSSPEAPELAFGGHSADFFPCGARQRDRIYVGHSYEVDGGGGDNPKQLFCPGT